MPLNPAPDSLAKKIRPQSQQQRTAATRRKLLSAAERVFARDGFEASRLEEIAAAAGYTRGAFYAHYGSKEDLFFDLMEGFVARKLRRIRAVLAQSSTPAGKWQALHDHYTRMACDRRWALLSLEFKLFAIRHPEARTRLAERYRRLRTPGRELLDELLRTIGRQLPISTQAATVALGASSNSLLIENLVDAAALTEDEIPLVLSMFFDAVLGKPSPRTANQRT